MNRIVLWVLLFWFLVGLIGAVRLVQVWIRAARDNRKRLQLCQDHVCSYYTDYLQKGPADLPHSAYHAALDALAFWQMRDELDEERGESHYYTAKMIDLYQRQARLS